MWGLIVHRRDVHNLKWLVQFRHLKYFIVKNTVVVLLSFVYLVSMVLSPHFLCPAHISDMKRFIESSPVTAAWASIRHQAGRFKLRVCRWRVCVFSIYTVFIWQLFRLQCPSHFLCWSALVLFFDSPPSYCESRFHLKHEAVLARLLWDPSSCFHISKLDIRLSHLLLSPSCIMLAAGADCVLFKSIFTL